MSSSLAVSTAVVVGEPLLITRSIELTTQFVGLAMLAAVLVAAAATVMRWQYHHEIPREFALLLGVSGVALYLTIAGLSETLIPDAAVDAEIALALFALTAFLSGAGGALAGRHIGTRFATDVLERESASQTKSDSKPQPSPAEDQRTQTVHFPASISDSIGYEPVTEKVKAALAGATFEYPVTLSAEELEQRLESRLTAEYDLAHADISVVADGTVTAVSVGKRSGGIGTTLPAETTAVAIRADPAPTASTGDLVQLWKTDPMRRVLTGELRGIADDIVTIAIDAADTPRIDPRRQYRLVTLPDADRPVQEFAELVTEADATVNSVTVKAGSPLHGLPVGALSVAILSLTHEDGSTHALPGPRTILTPGTEVMALDNPDELRRLSVAAEPLDPSLVPATAQTEKTGQPAETATESTQEETLPTTADSSTIADVTDEGTHDQEQTVPAETGQSTGDAETAQSGIAGKADGNRFAELKAQFDTEPSGTAETETADADDNSEADESSSESTFAQLKAEFDSGEAEWDTDDEPMAETVDADETDTTEQRESEPSEPDHSGGDDLVSLEDADISFGDDSGGDQETAADAVSEDESLSDLSFEESEEDDLAALSFEESDDDDLSSLSFDEDGESVFDDNPDGGFAFGESDEPVEQTEDNEPDDDTDDDNVDTEDDDDDDSSGGSTFAQLKSEFESGDADWADDISDSPGGDMRLDE